MAILSIFACPTRAEQHHAVPTSHTKQNYYPIPFAWYNISVGILLPNIPSPEQIILAAALFRPIYHKHCHLFALLSMYGLCRDLPAKN